MVDDYLKELPIKALPGIGRALEEKLKKKEVQTCGQLRMISKESLRKDFGFKTGDMLWNSCRGIDNRLVGMIQESKSIGAEVNWGVRFNDLKDSQHFLINLCKEVALRLQGCGVRGHTFTLKVKKRKADAEEPTKYMGCGDCDNLSHSMTVPMATDDVDVLQRITTQLFGLFHVDVKDIRGMGLQVSKLESADNDKQGHERNSIRSWLVSPSAGTGEHCEVSSLAGKSANIDTEEQNDGNFRKLDKNLNVAANMSNGEATVHQDSALPPLCDLDMGVIESLPPELLSEINHMYGGKLTSLMLKRKGKTVDIGSISTSLENVEGLKLEETAPRPNLPTLRGVPIVEEARQELHLLPASSPENYGLMPSSLSQVDVSVLQQLPEELRVDLLELLPAHRGLGCALDASPGPHNSFRLNSSMIQPRSEDHVSYNEVWNGSPPRWVEKFEASDCQILKVFAGKYRGSGYSGNLSSILLQIMSETCFSLDGTTDGWNDAISYFLEVFKQYIKQKIESDIEEIYICFCLLRRLSAKSEFFMQVYDLILPHLQATVGEKYGGIFPI